MQWLKRFWVKFGCSRNSVVAELWLFNLLSLVRSFLLFEIVAH